MASNVVRSLHVDDDEVTSAVFGDQSLAPASADQSTTTVDTVAGYYKIIDAGAAKALGVPRATVSKFAGAYIVTGALEAGDAAAGIISQENNYGSDLIVLRVEIDLTTAAAGACTADVGIAATSVSSDTIMDGIDLGAAVTVFGSIDDQGTNGNSAIKWPDGQYLTASMATGATAGLVGTFTAYVLDMN